MAEMPDDLTEHSRVEPYRAVPGLGKGIGWNLQ